MIDGFIQNDALPWLQPGIFLTGNRFYHQLQLAAEHAALVVLITQLNACLGREAFELIVCLRHHLSKMGFQFLPREPGAARPDDSQCNHHTRSYQRFFHFDIHKINPGV